MIYVLDTNIITEILKGNEKVRDRLLKVILEGREIAIHCICYYETKRGLLAKKATSKLKNFDSFCNDNTLLLLDTKIVFDKASEIYAYLHQKGQLISDADILIASTSILQDLTLVTNDSDFNRISGLKTENWIA